MTRLSSPGRSAAARSRVGQWIGGIPASCDQLFPIGFTDTGYVTPMRFPHRFASTAHELQSSGRAYLGVEKRAVIRTQHRA